MYSCVDCALMGVPGEAASGALHQSENTSKLEEGNISLNLTQALYVLAVNQS